MNRIGLVVMLLLSIKANAVEQLEPERAHAYGKAIIKAIDAETDENALEACQEPKPVDYEWVLETCMKIRADYIKDKKLNELTKQINY